MNFKQWLEDWQDGLPHRSHDYDASWDYEEDEEPQLTVLVDGIVKGLKANLLPEIRVFRDFDIAYVTGLDELGKYASGTSTHPVIMLDMGNIQKACKEYGAECKVGIETTIVHELAHAIQEMFDMPMDEDEAEKFAYVWDRDRRSTDFWREET